ncbi:sigma factor-like helix-turn-helix DNA-binding protein [Streptomyces pseudovenezuelae]|uniref:sigma factor-like helix-turn-helix DNA-binding protein n=1 Tax=Streptomyces pseudovenezuelae TaxID=67350 RepID=UPI0034A4DE5F
MTGTEEFEELRPLLFAIACRILGSATEAEHAVRATWLHWRDMPTPSVSTGSRLAAEITRICTGSPWAARQRGQEHGPRQVRRLTDAHEGVERSEQLADSLLTAALSVLERLSPLERAVFVLREAFGCGVSDIASAVGCSQAACRQLIASIAMTSDGGRDPLPWPSYVAGAANVARLLAAIVPPLMRIGIRLEECSANGRPGSLFRDRNGNVLTTLVLDIREGRNSETHLVLRPVDGPEPLVPRLLG